jgi:hypothetical protein
MWAWRGASSLRTALLAEQGELVTSELAVAEADYLILDRLGPEAEAAFLDDSRKERTSSSAWIDPRWPPHATSSRATATFGSGWRTPRWS